MVMMVLADPGRGGGGCNPMNFVCAAQGLNPYPI